MVHLPAAQNKNAIASFLLTFVWIAQALTYLCRALSKQASGVCSPLILTVVVLLPFSYASH